MRLSMVLELQDVYVAFGLLTQIADNKVRRESLDPYVAVR